MHMIRIPNMRWIATARKTFFFFWGGTMAQMKMGEGNNFQIAGNIVT